MPQIEFKKNLSVAIFFMLCFFNLNVKANFFELGAVNYQYNKRYKSSDSVIPYVTAYFNNLSEQKLNIFMKYDYQIQYGKKNATSSILQFKTERNRFYFILGGWKWNTLNYSFLPRFGFKYEHWRINKNNPYRQNSQKLELRFYPNMVYKFSNSISLYINGFVAPVLNMTKQSSSNQSVLLKDHYYYNDYYQELQLAGLRYSITPQKRIWVSLYNEIKHQTQLSQYQLWQLRAGYYWHITSQFHFSPYIRRDLYYKEKNMQIGKSYGTKKRKDATKIGMISIYKVNSNFTAINEFYYQIAKNQNYKGFYSQNKNHAFYKIGFRMTF